MFMQAGFAMLEVGYSRMKNVGTIVAKVVTNLSVSSIAYWAVGFGFAFGAGGWFAFLGGSGFFPTFSPGSQLHLPAIDASTATASAKWFFEFVFCAVSLAIVWGTTVVHLTGATAGFAGLLLLGPRIGKYEKGRPNAIPGHNMPLAQLGVLILWFGWFGFNPGSTLNATNLHFADVVVVTNLAAAAGAVVALATVFAITKTMDVGMIGNGAIAALVAITAPSGYVEPWAAIVIGAVAGVIVVVGVRAIDKYLDDPVGALPAHGLAGIWGTLSCGRFTVPALAKFNAVGGGGLFYTGSFHQLGARAIAVAASFLAVFAMSYGLFWVIKKTVGLRVSTREELEGLDISEHGMWGYPESFMPVPGGVYRPPDTPTVNPHRSPEAVGGTARAERSPA